MTLRNAEATLALGARLAKDSVAGDVFLLVGELGAGKTTLVRGFVGHHVKSPSFNLIQEVAGDPPIMHADLYRLQSAVGLGLEEYFDSHICLIEWPEGKGIAWPTRARRIHLLFEADHRVAELS